MTAVVSPTTPVDQSTVTVYPTCSNSRSVPAPITTIFCGWLVEEDMATFQVIWSSATDRQTSSSYVCTSLKMELTMTGILVGVLDTAMTRWTTSRASRGAIYARTHRYGAGTSGTRCLVSELPSLTRHQIPTNDRLLYQLHRRVHGIECLTALKRLILWLTGLRHAEQLD